MTTYIKLDWISEPILHIQFYIIVLNDQLLWDLTGKEIDLTGKIEFYCVRMSQSLFPISKIFYGIYSAFFTENKSRMTWRQQMLMLSYILLIIYKAVFISTSWNSLYIIRQQVEGVLMLLKHIEQHYAVSMQRAHAAPLIYQEFVLVIMHCGLSHLSGCIVKSFDSYMKQYLIYGHSRRHTAVWPHLTIILTPATLSQFESYYSRKEGRDK